MSLGGGRSVHEKSLCSDMEEGHIYVLNFRVSGKQKI